MALNVGELVAYAKIDRSDVKRGTAEIASEMKAMQASTSASMAGMEASAVRSLSQVKDAIKDGLDPAEAVRSLDKLEEAVKGSLHEIEVEAEKLAAQVKDKIPEGFEDSQEPVEESGEETGKKYRERVVREVGKTGAEIRAKLEAVTANLPKIKVGVDATDADVAIANIRESLQGLSDQKVGVDVDSATALAQVELLKHQLEELDRMDVDPVIKADVRSALKDLGQVEGMLGKVEQVAAQAFQQVGDSAEKGLGVIGEVGPAQVAIVIAAIESLPTVAGLAASGIVAAIGGGLLAVGFKTVATADDVRQAWKDTVDEIKSQLETAAQPLEGSAIRAADVAERAFKKLTPSLKRIFADLVPDVDHFVAMVGKGVGSLGPTLERIGTDFGDILSELGNRMPAIMDNIKATLNTFAEIMEEDPTLLADAVEDATKLLEVGAKVLSWADEIKVAFSIPFGPVGAQAGSDYFSRQVFGGTPEEIAAGLEALPTAMATTKQAIEKGAEAMLHVKSSGDDAASGVRNLSQALKELFDPAAAALDAEIRMKQALQDAAKAAKEHKLGEVDRLSTVRDVTQAIADAAATEQDRTGKTTKASKAFADQLPTLVDLAGKNRTARDTIAALGNSLGVTVAKTNDGKVAVDKFGKAVITLPNGKKVKVDADTAKAIAGLGDTKKKVDDVKGKTVKVDADTKKAVTEVDKVTSKMKGLGGDARTAGANVGSGLVAGIKSTLAAAAEAGRSLAQSALNAAKNLLGIHSPSTAMAEVGKWTVKGLIQGLTSEEGNVQTTIERLVDKVKKAFGSKPDVADHLLDFIKMGNKNLEDLALQREALVKRLADAKEYAKKVAGDAKEWASIMGLTQDEVDAGDFSGSLKDRAQQIKDFANDVKRLAERGLNKTTLRQIIDAGVEKGATIADMLVGAPGSEIKAINTAQKQIDNMSKQLGKSGADALYDTGKKAGEGYLKGLQYSLKKLDSEMTKIVKALVAAIKRELKIKSPSQVMAEIGVDTIQGWIVGMNTMSDPAQNAVRSLIQQSVAAARKIAGQPVSNGTRGIPGAVQPLMPTSASRFYSYDTSTGIPSELNGQGPPSLTVDLRGSTIREEADVPKLVQLMGLEYSLRGATA